MKVQFEECVAGPNFVHKPGKITTVDDAEGCRFCAKGIASTVDDAGEKLLKAHLDAVAKAEAAAVAAKAAAKK